MRIYVVTALALFALTGCMTSGSVNSLTHSNDSHSEYEKHLAPLIQQSEQLNQSLAKKGLLYRKSLCVDYLNQMAQRLAPSFNSERIQIEVFIVKNAIPNAMALPNGDIYLFSGLLALVENESQLASVLAHEIGHVVEQHGLRSAISRRNTMVAAHIADIFLAGTALSYLPAGASLASFSRQQERDADALSLEYLQKANFDLSQSPKVFELFSKMPESRSFAGSIYSSHPDNAERVAYLSELIQEQYSDAPVAAQSSAEFEKIREDIFELNVKLRLRAKQYQMALDLLEQGDAYYTRKTLIDFYRGEVYRAMAENPELAAKELAWLNSRKVTDEDKQKFKSESQANLQRAKQHYERAMKTADAPIESYRGLAMVYIEEGNQSDAKLHLETYLKSDQIKDRLYYTHVLNKLK